MIVCVIKPCLTESIDKSTWYRHFLIFCMARVNGTSFHCMSYHKSNCLKKKKKSDQVSNTHIDGTFFPQQCKMERYVFVNLVFFPF